MFSPATLLPGYKMTVFTANTVEKLTHFPHPRQRNFLILISQIWILRSEISNPFSCLSHFQILNFPFPLVFRDNREDNSDKRAGVTHL